MMIKYFYFLVLLFCTSKVLAQSTTPYLSEEGLYGLADIEGNIVIEPLYDEIYIHHSGELMITKKGDKYGVVNYKGQIVLDPIMTTSLGHRVFPIKEQNGKTIRPHSLYSFTDYSQNKAYYINPYHPIDEYGQLMILSEASRNIDNFCFGLNNPEHLAIRVAEANGRINFIDTTARLIFESPVFDGKVISKNHLALRNEANLYALSNIEGEMLTEYKFDDLEETHRDWIIGGIRLDNRSTYYQLLDNEGKVLLDNKEQISINETGMLIVGDKESQVIMNDKMEVLYEAEPGDIRFLNSSHFIIGQYDSLTIIDLSLIHI